MWIPITCWKRVHFNFDGDFDGHCNVTYKDTQSVTVSGGSRRRGGQAPDPAQKNRHFHLQFSGYNGQIVGDAPFWEMLDPPLMTSSDRRGGRSETGSPQLNMAEENTNKVLTKERNSSRVHPALLLPSLKMIHSLSPTSISESDSTKMSFWWRMPLMISRRVCGFCWDAPFYKTIRNTCVNEPPT